MELNVIVAKAMTHVRDEKWNLFGHKKMFIKLNFLLNPSKGTMKNYSFHTLDVMRKKKKTTTEIQKSITASAFNSTK